MKYLITENKFKSIMFKHFLDLFEHNPKGELNWTYGMDDFGNEIEDHMYYYFGDWGNQDLAFELDNVNCDDRCPLLYMDNDIKKELDLMFNDKWVEPFKEFVKDNYNITFNSLSNMYEVWETKPNDEDDEEFDDDVFDLDDEN